MCTQRFTEPRQTPQAEPHDEARDATTLDLIRIVLDMGVPLFVICRGIQELNVALGGTLQSEVQDQPGKMDHREIKHDDMDTRYGPRHKIMLRPAASWRAFSPRRDRE